MFFLRHLRTDIVERPTKLIGLGIFEVCRPAKITQLDDSVHVEEVLGLDVAVDDEVAVHVFDGFEQLEEDLADDVVVGTVELVQGLAVDVLGYEEDVVGVGETTV